MNHIEWIDGHKDELIEKLSALCAIRSVGGEPAAVTDESGTVVGTAPFGLGVQGALEHMLKMGTEDGFESKNIDNYGGHIEWRSEQISPAKAAASANAPETVEATETEVGGGRKEARDGYLGILAHLDVVPEGNGWTREPYRPALEGNKLYGRGTIDDKGPLMAAYFAMRALKETGFEPKRPVRIILGLDEETGWKGINHYFSREEKPAFGFTPDADFPVIQGEMGLLIFEAAKKLSPAQSEGLELRSMQGGSAPNMVADSARAVIRERKLPAGKKGKKKAAASKSGRVDAYEKVKELAKIYRDETGYKLNFKGIGSSLEISASGNTAHGAMPWEGLNAISVLMDFLGRINFVNEDANEFIDFYNRHVGFDLHGERLGIGFEDEVSGKLILNVGLLDMDEKAAKLTMNIRYPVTLGLEGEIEVVDGEDHSGTEAVYEGMQPIFDSYGMGVVRIKEHPPIYLPGSSELVSTLMDVYREYTGYKDAKPEVIGGGTYARSCGNVLGFGMVFPGEELVEHRADEYVNIDSLLLATKIYAEAIRRLAG